MDDQKKRLAPADVAAGQVIGGVVGMSAAAWMTFGSAAGLAVFSAFLVLAGMRGLRG